MGLAASMEEQNANSEEGEFQTESISMIKTSLMGPFAGIGDSFFQGTIRIITFGIGLSFATAGQHPGTDSSQYCCSRFRHCWFAYNATFFGYRSGNKYLAKLYQEGLMDRVMHFAVHRRSRRRRRYGSQHGVHHHAAYLLHRWYESGLS